jgi:hypothetical protein
MSSSVSFSPDTFNSTGITKSTTSTNNNKSKTDTIKKRKSSLKSTTSFPIDDEDNESNNNKPARKSSARPGVSFLESVTVRSLPQEEAEAAADTRRGEWQAAPDHDELWDGDNKDFWEEEKTIEEVRRIVVIRGMRMALQYNLGYAFFSMVANFRKRHEKVKYNDEATGDDHNTDDKGMIDDMIIQYDKPEDEEMAIRKEIRELFADSVKGLDFPDLVQDREAFEKIYMGTVLLGIGLEDRSKYPEAGLQKIEKLVDEIMYVEDVCCLVDVVYVAPKETEAEHKSHENAEKAADYEQTRRTERRKSIEMLHGGETMPTAATITTTTTTTSANTISNSGRRTSVERRPSLTKKQQNEDTVLIEPTILPSTISPPSSNNNSTATSANKDERRTSIERRTTSSDARRLSLEGRNPIIIDEVESASVGSESGRRLSLEKRPSNLSISATTMTTSSTNNSPITVPTEPSRRISVERRPSITPTATTTTTSPPPTTTTNPPERRTSITSPQQQQQSPSTPTTVTDTSSPTNDDNAIFPSRLDGRRASVRGRRPSVDPNPPSPAITAGAIMAGDTTNTPLFGNNSSSNSNNSTINQAKKQNPVVTMLSVLFLLIWSILTGIFKAAMKGVQQNHAISTTTDTNNVATADDGQPTTNKVMIITRPNGAWSIPRIATWLIPLIVFVGYELRGGWWWWKK